MANDQNGLKQLVNLFQFVVKLSWKKFQKTYYHIHPQGTAPLTIIYIEGFFLKVSWTKAQCKQTFLKQWHHVLIVHGQCSGLHALLLSLAFFYQQNLPYCLQWQASPHLCICKLVTSCMCVHNKAPKINPFQKGCKIHIGLGFPSAISPVTAFGLE